MLLLYAYIEERIRLKNIKSKFIKYDQDLKEFSIKCNIPYSFFKEINDLGHCIVLEKKKSDCSFIPKVAVVEFDKHKIKRSSIEEIAQKYNLSLYNTSSELLGNAILVSSVKEYNDLINLFGLKDANNLSYEKSLDEIIKKHSNSLKPIVKGIDED